MLVILLYFQLFYQCTRLKSLNVSQTNIISHSISLIKAKLEQFESSAIGQPEQPTQDFIKEGEVQPGSLFAFAASKIYDQK